MDKRNSRQYMEWKSRVNVRDNFTCQDCGKKDVNETHHIKSWIEYPELRFNVSNGKTLCLDCHKKYRTRERPKTKNGKRVNIYLSYTAIEKLKEKAWKNKTSVSNLIEVFSNEQ